MTNRYCFVKSEWDLDKAGSITAAGYALLTLATAVSESNSLKPKFMPILLAVTGIGEGKMMSANKSQSILTKWRP